MAPVLGNLSLSSGSDWSAGAQEHPAQGQEGEVSRVLFRTHGRNSSPKSFEGAVGVNQRIGRDPGRQREQREQMPRSKEMAPRGPTNSMLGR